MPVGSQNWTTLAENDTDAWKCLALVRSLKASISTRHAVVLLSKNVSQNMWLKLQSECKACYLVIEDEFFTSLEFRSGALRYASEKWSHFVWLDCNCLVVNNCDDLFHRSGVQWAKNEDGRVVPVFLSSTAAESELGDTKKYITLGENGRNSGEELDYCHVIDLDSSTNNPLCGKNLKLIYFSNGHPLEPTSYDEGSTKTANLDNDLKKKATELYKRFCPELFPSNTIQPITNEMPSQVTNSIAIVGMACRYPGANSIAEFWELLVNGLDGISKVPERRWTKENALCRMGNWRSTEAGFLFCSIENFDSKFFNTNAADMQFLDPQQRLSLRVVWEALEHARIDPLSLKNSLTGVFGGWWRGDYKELLQMQGALFDTDFLRGYMGNALGPFTARISHFLELIGPSFSTESGCSTSVVGVDMACDSLRNEACNLAIAVGANLLLHPYTLGDGLMEGVLARDGRCKTFDSSADGFGRAEGIGVLILKRYSDAIGDGDRIWGLILGSAVVQEGPSKSMGTPTVGVEAKAMELGLERAGVAPNQVQYVEMHGTGTPIGDPIEVEAVSKAYSNRENILTIGSVKTNIGHTESVCGIASIQKVVLSMHHEIIPEHLHFKKLNPEIDLASIPAQIPLKQVEWKRAMDNGQLRIAGVNSFGITGAQAHVIVQEPPANGYPSEDMKITFHDERPRKIFTISAKTETSFHSQVEAYKTFLTTTDCSLSDIELTMHTGRAHFLLRGIAICDTKEELIASLDLLRPKHVPNSGSKLCFLFTGQGSQYIGMAKSLYEESIVFRSNFELCETILFTEHGISIKDVLWNSSSKPDFMNQTLFSQTSIFCVEFCLLKLWESWGVVPDAVMGHSLGEFVAAVAAGILTLHDALKLVVSRSILIESLPKSGMIVVGADLQTSRKHLNNAFTNTSQKWLDIAAVNSTGQTVMAGTTENIQEFHTYCKNNGVKTHILKSSHAFHSKLLDPILEKYKRIVDTIDFSPATRCTFISAVSGREITSTDSDYWIRHTREKVCFMEASKAAANLGITGFIEVGPQPVLSALLLENIDEIVEISILAPSLKKNEPEWETMLSTLGKLYLTGIKINWSGFHRYTNARKVDVPGYQFDEVPYWVTVKNGNRTHFHPLLGVYVPNASDITIFNNSIDVQRLPFLKDHSLGDKIIYPCAGYLDMCMTSSYVASECKRGMFTKPTSMLTITNFSIITPICLTEGQPIDTQVVVSQTPEGGMCSTIYSEIQLDNQEYKWVKNATAQFGTFTPDFNNLPELLDIKKRCYDVVMDTLDYKVFEEYGFNFGPTLRVMTRVWGNSGGEYLFKFEVFESDEDIDRFIIHPWIVDSMLQAQIISMFLFNRPPAKQLFVPVQIASFAWFGHVARSGYVYTSIGSGYNEAYLFDEDGNRMTCMRGAEFVPTNLSNLLALIDAQKNPLPSMAEYSWRQFLGPEERRIPDEERGSICLKDIVNSCNLTDAEFTQEEEQFYNNLQSLAGLYMIKVAKQLHLDNLKEFKWPQIAETSNIAPKLYTFFRRLLGELVADGLIEQTNESDFKIIRKFQSLDKIQNQIDAIVHDLQKLQIDWIDMELASIQSIGDCLYNIILTDDKSVPKNVEHNFLTTSLFARKMNSLNPIQKDLLTELSKLGSKSVIRILQLGGGIGTPAAKYALSKMVEIGGFHFEYTITDIDKSVATEVENMFHDTGITAKFLQLNLENDPLAQGFIPNYYDAIIVPLLIFHGTQSSADAVENSAKLLKHGGYIFISEIIKPCRHIDMMLGGTGNFELSPITNWEIVLETNGFCDIVSVPVYAKAGALILAKLGSPNFSILTDKAKEYNKSKWIIFGDDGSTTSNLIDKLKQICCSVEIIRNTHTISPSEMMEARIREIFEKSSHSNIQGVIYLCGIDQPLETRQVSEPFLYICKYLAKVQSPLKVVTCTRGNMCIGSSDFDLTAPVSSPIIAMTNVLANENPDLICKCIDIGASDDACAEIFSELFITDIDVMVAYRAGQRWTPRIKPLKLKNNPLMIPKTSRYRLVLPATKTIEDLHFEPCQPEPLGEGEVEIEVKACGLNFRDLFCITKPDPAFANFNTLGVDMAGYITAVGPGCGPERKVGDRVVHCRRHGISLPSHIVVPAGHTVLISNDMTFADAATFPLGYITVVQCLERVAKIDASDIVLIHTASGGVGLIGIQMAQEYGSTIVATAGNKRKRNYLRSLGVKYVFNSRTTNYAQKVRKALGGRGVTVVLNSLTGPGFKEATLSLCEPGARFVEISKMNIWDVEEFEKLRPDVQYNIVDVSVLEMSVLVSIMRDGLAVNLGSNMKTNKLIPLPYVRFDSCDIRQALELMEKTRHVGKIVVTMPEKCVTGGSEVTQKSQLLYPEGTYLITGGLGGIGMEVVKWMASSGAKNILLIGRNPPKPAALTVIKDMTSSGVRVEARQCDVGDFADLMNFHDHVSESFSPIRGIIHAAGILDDGTFENQTWEKYETVFHSKVKGSWNLHMLSLRLKYPLEHFVLFSSTAATLAAMGQSNYSSGNYFLDELAHYRNALGLPATTINWGQWAQVGMAANIVFPLFKPMSINQGIAALENIMKSHKTQVLAYEADLGAVKNFLKSTKGLLAEFEKLDTGESGIDGDEFWSDFDSAPDSDAKYQIIRGFLKKLLRTILKIGKHDEIKDDENFQEMGVDSLMMVEMKNGIQASIGKRVKISINSVKDCKTVAELSKRLVNLITQSEDFAPLTPDALLQLALEDGKLPHAVKVDVSLRHSLCPLSNICTVLVTGGTGNLGPYVVRELLRRTHIKKIICVMRKHPYMAISQRFRFLYEKKNLLSEIEIEKIEFVEGDVTEKNLGMEDSTYALLCGEVDAIFNCAVIMEMHTTYKTDCAARSINVIGTKNVLEFAVEQKLKYVYQSSSIIAEAKLGEDGTFSQNWPFIEDISLIPNSAYATSKFISDCLVAQAVARGVPAKLFRFPHMSGDSVTGGNVQMDSFVMIRFLSYLNFKHMPIQKIPISILPVDKCAQFSMELFFKEETGFEVFNVYNPHLDDELNFEEMARTEFGIVVKPITTTEFFEKLNKVLENDTVHEMAKLITPFDSELRNMENSFEPYISWMNGNQKIFWSHKLEQYLPEDYPGSLQNSMDYLRQDLQCAKESGVFERYNIK